MAAFWESGLNVFLFGPHSRAGGDVIAVGRKVGLHLHIVFSSRMQLEFPHA